MEDMWQNRMRNFFKWIYSILYRTTQQFDFFLYVWIFFFFFCMHNLISCLNFWKEA